MDRLSVSDPVDAYLSRFVVGAVFSCPGRQLAVSGADLSERAVGCVFLVRVCICKRPFVGASAKTFGSIRFPASCDRGCGFDGDFYAAAVRRWSRTGCFLCSVYVCLCDFACR